MELEAQRKDKGRQEEEEVTEEIHDTGNGKGIFFIWGGTVSFWGTGHEHRMVHKCCSSHSECNPVLPCHLWRKNRATTQTSLDRFFKRVDRTESSKEPELVPSMSGMSEIAACPVSYCWGSFSSTISHLPSLFWSVTLLACSLDASACMPVVVLYYCTFQGAVL